MLKRTRPLMLFVLCILTFILLLCPAACAEENLIENGDFTAIDDENLPEYWFTDAFILDTGYTVFSVKEGDPEHPVYVEINNIGSNDARFAQTVPVEPDSLYCLSGYIRAEDVQGGHGANLSVEGVYAFSEECYDTGGAWKYISYYGETGPDQEYVTVFARVGGYSGESTGKADFAELSLTRVDSVPGEEVADLWFRTGSAVYEDDEEEPENGSAPFWPWLLLISAVYAAAAAVMLNRDAPSLPPERKKPYHAFVLLILFLALVLRVMIASLVEGYMVDVNCFLSWGHTMAALGPARFYEGTNFCDYPPLYTYVLGLNSFLADKLNADAAATRIIFRLIPSVCDLAASLWLYGLLNRQKRIQPSRCLAFLCFLAFNPAAVLNSAAWGQMDSVLCLLLLIVAVYATEGRWIAALPLYVVSVLIKPQALMLGPLGLTYIIRSYACSKPSRRPILTGTGISLLTLAAGVIPFSIRQNWDWLIQLYGRTLASYPYATVNTANLYYLLGGNWAGVEKTAHLLAPVVLGLLTIGYGIWWYKQSKELPHRVIETALCVVFSAGFLVLAVSGGTWAWTGGLAMAFVFVIALGQAVRSRDIRLLPYLGALIYILLYVFGIKMHERYIFPALLLLASAWVILRDRRILLLTLLFTFTLFMNEGIVLDNSIRLGSSYGHLNQDTVWLADILCVLNLSGAVYSVYLSLELFLGRQSKGLPRFFHIRRGTSRSPLNWRQDRTLHWTRKDTAILMIITAVYSAVSLTTLGSTKAPQTAWTSSSLGEQIVFDLGEKKNDFEILYFAQVSRNDFSFAVSDDGESWTEQIWAQMDQGQCWKWKYVTESSDSGERRVYYNSDQNHIIRFSGRYVKLSAYQLGLTLNEVLFRTEDGAVLPAVILKRTGEERESELYSDPSALLDEPDTLEKLPSLPESEITASTSAQPSWWNSTYFDEIYHARTAFEFLHGTVPYETSHPPLGKVLMSLSVALFGMTPFGWRFAGALAGILMLPGMYLLAKQLTKKTFIAMIACLLMTFDCQHLTQSQIATIDSFPVLFIIFAYFFMLRFLQTDCLREKIGKSLIPLCFSGCFMGLSVASKWIGIYAGAGLAVLFFFHCFRTIRLQKEAVQMSAASDLTAPDRISVESILPGPDTPPAFRRVVTLCCWCILFFVLIPLLIYLLSYIPYFAYNAKRIHTLWDYIDEVWRAQVGMFNYHSTPNLGMDHPFYSPWWEWPIIRKPMYYAAEQYIPDDFPVHHSIFCFGNPVIWFGGLAALACCVIRALRSHRYCTEGSEQRWHLCAENYDIRYAFLFIGLLAQYLPWVLVPRGTYIYHYFASLPFLMLSISLCFDGFRRMAERIRNIAALLLILAALAAFILLFPYASGISVSPEWLDIGKSLLRIWY